MTVSELLAKNERALQRLVRQRAGGAVLQRISLDDLYQEIVVEALASADSYEHRAGSLFLRWMATITKRVIARKVYDDGRSAILPLRGPDSVGTGVPADRLPSPERTPSSVVSRKDDRSAILAAIMQLPEQYRYVLTLFSILQWPVSAVATQLNRSEKATYCLLARATRALREVLEERNGLSHAPGSCTG